MNHPDWSGRLRRARSIVLLAVVLTVTALVVPPASVREAPMSLVRVQKAQAVDHARKVLWILMLGSDARPGQAVLRSRADAIQLVGINTETGSWSAIGIPRDSYVNVPGYGRQKINSALTFGGPQLMARAVGDMVGLRPDYVFTTGFDGFRFMVRDIGGITVRSKYTFYDPVMPGGYRRGLNRVNGFQAMIFARIRKSLPAGDFDRSRNQQRTLMGILKEVRKKADQPGFMERALLSVTKNLDTDLRPSELFVLAQAATELEPGKFSGCVVSGSTGYAGAASVVFPNISQARTYANRARNDATLGRC